MEFTPQEIEAVAVALRSYFDRQYINPEAIISAAEKINLSCNGQLSEVVQEMRADYEFTVNHL